MRWSAAAGIALLGVVLCLFLAKPSGQQKSDAMAGKGVAEKAGTANNIPSEDKAGQVLTPAEEKPAPTGKTGNGASGMPESPKVRPQVVKPEITKPVVEKPVLREPDAGSGQVITPESEILALNIGPFGIRTSPVNAPAINLPTLASHPLPQFHAPVGRWMLGVGLMQNQSGLGYTVNPEYSQYVHKNYLERMRSGESSLGAVQAGFMAAWRLSRKGPLSVFAGLNYMQRNTRQRFEFSDEVPVTLRPGRQPDKFGNYPIIGYFSPSGSVSYSGFTRMTVFEVPLGMIYELRRPGSRWSLIPSISANLGFIASESGNTLDYQLLTVVPRSADWFRTTVVNGNAGLGLYRDLSRSLRLGAGVNTSYSATPVYVPGASVRPRTWAVGFGTQLIWRID